MHLKCSNDFAVLNMKIPRHRPSTSCHALTTGHVACKAKRNLSLEKLGLQWSHGNASKSRGTLNGALISARGRGFGNHTSKDARTGRVLVMVCTKPLGVGVAQAPKPLKPG